MPATDHRGYAFDLGYAFSYHKVTTSGLPLKYGVYRTDTFVLTSNGQGKQVVLGSNNGSPSYLAGSLPKSSSGVYQKLKIEIFGGNWHSSNLGENHYYISTRDGLKINQEVHGGSYSKYDLKIYDNGSNYDFVIQVTDNYPSFHLRSWKISGTGTSVITESTISDYDPTGKTDVTGQFPINVIFAADNSGNIGIGTINTFNYKLAVNGTIGSTEVKVENTSAWPDFVFESDYKLRTLEEVEQHINESGHLPEIPSEAEVTENGINLGEMDAKLLQKIEELTLYLIEQNKENQEQRKLIEDLQKEVSALKNE